MTENKTMHKKAKQQNLKRIFTLPLFHGDDLLDSISSFCQKKNIKTGLIMAIGALQKAKIGYYLQKEKKYKQLSINKPVEIISCLGNVSLKNNKPFVHLHVSLADAKGRAFGGHLNKGSLVFASECFVFELKGEKLERKFHPLTGLSLWDFIS